MNAAHDPDRRDAVRARQHGAHRQERGHCPARQRRRSADPNRRAETDQRAKPGELSVLNSKRQAATLLVRGAFAAMPTAGALVPAPPSAAAEVSVAERTPPAVSVGPGAVAVTVIRLGYTFRIEVNPNRVAAASSVALELTRNGRRVRTASVRLSLDVPAAVRSASVSTGDLHTEVGRANGWPLEAHLHRASRRIAATHRATRRSRRGMSPSSFVALRRRWRPDLVRIREIG